MEGFNHDVINHVRTQIVGTTQGQNPFHRRLRPATDRVGLEILIKNDPVQAQIGKELGRLLNGDGWCALKPAPGQLNRRDTS